MIRVSTLLHEGLNLATIRRCGAQLRPAAADWFSIERGCQVPYETALSLYVLHYLVKFDILAEPQAISALQYAKDTLSKFADSLETSRATGGAVWSAAIELIDRRWLRTTPLADKMLDLREHRLHNTYPVDAPLPVYVQAIQLIPLGMRLWQAEMNNADAD